MRTPTLQRYCLVLAGLLSACGQQGPLYLPEQQAPEPALEAPADTEQQEPDCDDCE